jgi:hypothetical protein
MSVYPLINPRDVFQPAMGVLDDERPATARTLVGTKCSVIRVYPVGHDANPSGQMLADVLPLRALPILFGVPVAHMGAHEETEQAKPLTADRNATDPKPRNRVQGQAADIRPGTLVWVTFLGGNILQPVITATLGFDQGGDKGTQAGTYAPSVDVVQADGTVAPATRRPLDSAMAKDDQGTVTSDYPKSVSSYNGVRHETDNTGSHYIQTSTDRDPVWTGAHDIPAAPAPQGNYGVSTRGAPMGNIRFTTGRAVQQNGDGTQAVLTSDDESHVGRHERASLNADDGTIRDDTASKIGNIIARIRSGGRYYVSARGGKDGVIYHEAAGGAYTLLDGDADIHGGTATLNAGTVKLGGPGMGDEVVLWPQLVQVLTSLCALYDKHTHGGVQSGTSFTLPTQDKQGDTLSGGKDSFKASDVFAGPSASPQANKQDDPDKRKDPA